MSPFFDLVWVNRSCRPLIRIRRRTSVLLPVSFRSLRREDLVYPVQLTCPSTTSWSVTDLGRRCSITWYLKYRKFQSEVVLCLVNRTNFRLRSPLPFTFLGPLDSSSSLLPPRAVLVLGTEGCRSYRTVFLRGTGVPPEVRPFFGHYSTQIEF